jgi:hypothetical protein
MKNRFSISALLAILAIPAISFAQGVRYDDVALLDTVRPVQGATVTVCGSGSTGTPCTTPTPIFNDSALSSPITQPGFQSGAQGNFFFYAACGKYDISITGNGITGRTKKDVQLGPCGTSAAIMPGSNISLTGASSGNNTTLLNMQGTQTAIVGNAGSQTMFTYTLPAKTVAVGKCLRITVNFQHSVGTASNNWALRINGQSVLALTNGSNGFLSMIVNSCSTSNTASANGGILFLSGSALAGGVPTTSGLSYSSNQTIAMQSDNLAGTDTVVPTFFMVELVQ